MTHALKTTPHNYMRIAEGSKTFELFDIGNDLPYPVQSGDTLVFKEYDPDPISKTDKNSPKGYTGSPDLNFKAGYVHHLGRHEYIVSLVPIKKAAPKSKTK